MTIPANLFVDAPELHDRSFKKLDSDADTWPEEIIQQLHEKIPQAASMSSMVKFKRKDEENGVATGSVIINSSDNSVVVPIIVKDFALRPLDIMIAKNKILPLTPDYFGAVFHKTQSFDKIEEFPPYVEGRFDEANLWNAVYPPSLGRYAYASSNYPILDEINGTIDGSELMSYLKENPEIAIGFKKHGHMDLLKKLAYLKPVNMNEFAQAENRLLPMNIKMLSLDGPNRYSLVSSNDEVFNPVINRVDRSSAEKIISDISGCVEDTMNEVDQNGEKMLALPDSGDPVHLRTPVKSDIVEATEFGHYMVKNKNGIIIEGIVIPKVIDFQQKRTDLKIFLGKTMSTMQPSIWGVHVKNSSYEPQSSEPTAGQTGTFVYMLDKRHAIATIPITIKRVIDDMGTIKIKAVDLIGNGYNIRKCPTMDLLRIAAIKDDTFILPNKMEWYPMEGFGRVSDSAVSYAIKEASEKLTNRAVKIAPTGYGFYSIRGVDKYASAAGWDKSMLKKAQVKFLLSCLGCSQEKIASAFETAKLKGVAELHGLRLIPTKDEKIASFRPKAAAMIKETKELKRNLVKEASYLDNAQTVDAMLALNFISPTNIDKFISKIPHFKATISNLASTLLAGRLGLQEIPEEAASVAMEKLIEVVDGLEKLKASRQADVGVSSGTASA